MSEENLAPQAEEAQDRKSLLSAAFDAEEASPAPQENAPEPTGERVRDEKGRFASLDQNAKPEQGGPPSPAPAEEPPLWARPPASWKKDFHEPWATVDPKVREYVWTREQEMAAGVEPLKTKAQVADAFEQAITPYKPIMQGLGVEPMAAIQGLMQNDYILRYGTQQQKQEKVLQLVRAYGLDLNALMGGVDPSQYAPIDPTVQALQNQLLELKGHILTREQMAEQAEEQTMLRELNAVTQGLEHWETVKETVQAILEKGLVEEGSIAEMTKAAYEKAIRLDDNLFQSVQAGRQAEQDAAKRQAAHNAAQNARRAAVSVPSSTPGTATKPNAQQERRELLSQQFDEVMSQRL